MWQKANEPGSTAYIFYFETLGCIRLGFVVAVYFFYFLFFCSLAFFDADNKMRQESGRERRNDKALYLTQISVSSSEHFSLCTQSTQSYWVWSEGGALAFLDHSFRV